jgi:integrase
MARQAKPWLRKGRGWFAWISGKQTFLGKDHTAAKAEFYRLMGGSPAVETDAPIVPLLDRFLLWVRTNRAALTFDAYRDAIQSFVDSLANKRLGVRDLRPVHLQDWIDSKDWSPTTKYNRVGAVQTAFNWLERQGLIDRSPVAKFRKSAPTSRDNHLTPEDFATMLALVKSPRLRDLLILGWETGARPQELSRLEVRHVDLERAIWTFPAREAKGKKRARTIYLSGTALEITARLIAGRKAGYVILNKYGRPWTRHSVNCAMKRLAKKFGRKIALYDLRHSFCTRKLIAGVDPATLAELMGHSNMAMIAKNYSHVYRDAGHLKSAAQK